MLAGIAHFSTLIDMRPQESQGCLWAKGGLSISLVDYPSARHAVRMSKLPVNQVWYGHPFGYVFALQPKQLHMKRLFWETLSYTSFNGSLRYNLLRRLYDSKGQSLWRTSASGPRKELKHRLIGDVTRTRSGRSLHNRRFREVMHTQPGKLLNYRPFADFYRRTKTAYGDI